MTKYGNRLKELREREGYSQQELADLLNITRSSIGMYEQGRRQPNFELSEALADLFNVPLDYLLARTPYAPIHLREDESRLLEYYNKLNSEGRKYLMSSAELATMKSDFLRDTAQDIGATG